MAEFIVEITPKKKEWDPLAKSVSKTLADWGIGEKEATVETKRLYKLEGDLSQADAKNACDTLLLDPVVETGALMKEKKSTKKTGGWVVEVWPRPGVTDPVGETVEKGVRDLGIQGSVKAQTGIEYVFPLLEDEKFIANFAKQQLGNELIHDIRLRKNS